jgi:large subunit ribosomal protein L20
MRTRSVTYTRKRKKKYFRLAKGSYATKKNRWRMVLQHVQKSLVHSYRGRKDRKADFRSLWITRIAALSGQLGLSYSRLMNGLRKSNVTLDRKMLSEMAVTDADSFRALAEMAKKAAVQ